MDEGMVNAVVAPEELDEAVANIANKYAVSAPKAVALIKRMLKQSYNAGSLNEMLEMEKACQIEAGGSQDAAEGIMAFVQKRKANFTGK